MNELILKILEKAEEKGLSHFGIRHHHKVVNVGDSLGCSFNCIDDIDSEKLSGICCMTISYDDFEVEDFKGDINHLMDGNYQDGSIILVGGCDSEYGNDDKEIIIKDAEVLFVIGAE